MLAQEFASQRRRFNHFFWTSHALYHLLNEGQADGKVITSDERGQPTLIDPENTWRAEAETRRQTLLAQANSLAAGRRVEWMLRAISDADRAAYHVGWITFAK
ncbi:tail fiber assembly protein [Cronobacter turicensis]|nr:tail fiber assembly protein [Cronobacter turicensis]EKY3209978.1 tail fiber assembly protein [Cronobacter turicensis]EKY3216374.1 tail fiber assembly protein [Cronobacter turicensis]